MSNTINMTSSGYSVSEDGIIEIDPENIILSPALSHASQSKQNIDPQAPLFTLPVHNTFRVLCENCQKALDSNSVNYLPDRQDLSSYLKQSFKGQLILNYYKRHKNLTDALSNNLAEIVLSREIHIILIREKVTVDNPLKKLEVSTKILKSLAEEIGSLFSERPGIYYSPGATDGKNKINPSGKLQSQLGYARKLLIECGLLVIIRRHSLVDEGTEPDSPISKLNFLKINTEDWEKIEQNWTDTHSTRQQLLAESIDKLIEFSSYPCPSGDKRVDLITSDFKSKFEQAECLQTSWPNLRSAFQDFILSERIDDADSALDIAKLTELVDDGKDAVIISVLPQAIKSSISSATKRRKVETASSTVDEKTKELLHSYILKVEKPDELEAKIEARRQKLITSKETFHPFMVFVGPPSEPVDFYVVVDNTKLKVKTALDALDVTFKIFLITSCQIPKFANNTYLLLKKAVYKISSSGKSSIQLQKAISFLEKKLNTTFD